MLAAGAQVFGLSIAELVIVMAAIGYIVSLFTDWRPMRELRRENGELKEALKSAQSRIDHLESKVAELEKSAVPEVARILDRVVDKLEHLDGSMKANTAAVEVLSKRKVIDEALSEGGVAA